MRYMSVSELYGTVTRRPLNLLSRYARFIKFATIGFSVMVIGMILLFALVQGMNIDKSLAYAIQAIVSINLNFTLNYLFTWSDRKPEKNSARAFLRFWSKFVGSRAVGAIANGILFTILSLYINYLISNVICVLLITVFNYVMSDKLVFTPIKEGTVATGTAELIDEAVDK